MNNLSSMINLIPSQANFLCSQNQSESFEEQNTMVHNELSTPIYDSTTKLGLPTQEKPFIDSLWKFILDEFKCIRSPRDKNIFVENKPLMYETANPYNNSESIDFIPKNRIRDLSKIPIKFEKYIFVGFLICLEYLLYELSIMPLQGLIAISKCLRSFSKDLMFDYSLSSFSKIYEKVLLIFKPINSKTVIDFQKYECKVSSLNVNPSYSKNLTNSELCDMTKLILLIAGVYMFKKFIDVSAVYHFIRAQSLMKLYVIFNMLEIFERLWRSLGRDALDSLFKNICTPKANIQIISSVQSPKTIAEDCFAQRDVTIYSGTPILESKALECNTALHCIGTPIDVCQENSISSAQNSPYCLSPAESFSNIPSTQTVVAIFEDIYIFFLNPLRILVTSVSRLRKRILMISLAILYIFVHSFTHLVRMLLLNIAINSSDSVMFLIITTNNFAEIKSTVFKKFNRSSLFIMTSSDVIERFYLFCDGLLVLLNIATSMKSPSERLLVACGWLVYMFFLELLVDWFKYVFLLKLNEVDTNVFEMYRRTIMSDVLTLRLPSIQNPNVQRSSKPLHKLYCGWKTPCRSYYSYPHACARRIGFIALPLAVRFICFTPSFFYKSGFILCIIHLLLLWLCLFLLKMITSLIIIAFSLSCVHLLQKPKLEAYKLVAL